MRPAARVATLGVPSRQRYAHCPVVKPQPARRSAAEEAGMVRRLLQLLIVVLTLALKPAAASATDPAVVEAARREGALAIADAAPGENSSKFMAAFKAKYPFLDVATDFYSAPAGG